MNRTGQDGERFLGAVDAVVRAQMCSGCGLCAAMDPRLRMREVNGFQRPVRVTDEPLPPARDRELARQFHAACPGVQVRAQRPAGSHRDATLGPVQGLWAAHATDPATRFRGSSGGVLTALNTFLLAEGEATSVLGARADAADPRRTVPVTIMSREQALQAAGSRYGPTATLSAQAAPLRADQAVTGKPCEASALRAHARAAGTDAPVILSFFCAGTPQQGATDALVEELGLPEGAPLEDLWYRGRGWPGEFTAVARDGRRVRTGYSASWGAALGPTVQWRCRVCADGVGESADISAGDYWELDAQGDPDFAERPGRSVLVARTARGRDIVLRAAAAGVIALEPVSARSAVARQPYQSARRRLLLGRLLGTRLLVGRVPSYRGFGLLGSALRAPRATWRELRGTITRIRDRRRRGFRS
ncbi:Coenzyme F420 hydrogenase/dehydrogenase, beta subunit C-terminal domain [Brachybacterium sp. YJGR34]|uniref:Coenzyme F420 hydrogenase/dehydrogenase, beta subunit C-terminal domain n=1 Tax=Brachybacterium sp. YJGR34 TaxID=2059911 RepID=UPI0018E64A85|nr:Coenzyme F420 hydrogenase/dehydrogenase, beta subunit C-terminal domain [Brachybacterium sp. YJGR34]